MPEADGHSMPNGHQHDAKIGFWTKGKHMEIKVPGCNVVNLAQRQVQLPLFGQPGGNSKLTL